MRKTIIFVTVSLLMLAGCINQNRLPRAAQDEMPCNVQQFDKTFDMVWGQGVDELHSLMVVKDGKVIYERYSTGFSPEFKHILFSATKTFTATAVGFARQDGLLNLDDKVISHLDESVLPAERCGWLEKMTIHDLLRMSSGLKETLSGRTRNGEQFNWVEEALKAGFIFEPGTRFRYNSVDSHILSVIVSNVTGMPAEEYMQAKLFDKLGIHDYEWTNCPTGESCGGFGLFMKTEDLAKMGLFMLERGLWNGERLLEEEWFDIAMSPQIYQWEGRVSPEEAEERFTDDDWNQGYCYQMWRCANGAVRMNGAWGQMCIICPEKNAVIVALSHTGDEKRLLDAIWKHIYCIL